jgi:hypothetical protein
VTALCLIIRSVGKAWGPIDAGPRQSSEVTVWYRRVGELIFVLDASVAVREIAAKLEEFRRAGFGLYRAAGYTNSDGGLLFVKSYDYQDFFSNRDLELVSTKSNKTKKRLTQRLVPSHLTRSATFSAPSSVCDVSVKGPEAGTG